MANAQEDFTFPTTTADDSPPRFLDSPPLWRHEKPKGKEVEEHKEERMDMLWEDLNDDQLQGNRGKTAQNSDISSPRREAKISCTKALKFSRANGQIISGKKTSILVFIKALKKVFLMHNSPHAIKKST